ncbi:hypothetical protein OH799_04225 [Nocardia sp. NBC_00881]|uniref:hypothetical protein n=1 Tax=Nocardia sp. NBC_00881 TaxID=2975995 RepID=UPI003863B91A|nr:hypothetical protein OH799_04225 [Nocardia sp. NBC_00881]
MTDLFGRPIPVEAVRLDEEIVQPIIRGERGCAELSSGTGESAVAAFSDSADGQSGFLTVEGQIYLEVAQWRPLSLRRRSRSVSYNRRGNRSDDGRVIPVRSPSFGL